MRPGKSILSHMIYLSKGKIRTAVYSVMSDSVALDVWAGMAWHQVYDTLSFFRMDCIGVPPRGRD